MLKFTFIKWLTSNMKTLFTLSSKELSKKSGIYKLSCVHNILENILIFII